MTTRRSTTPDRLALAAAGLAVISASTAALVWFLTDDNTPVRWTSAAAGAFAMAGGCSAGLRGSPIGWVAVGLAIPGVIVLVTVFLHSVEALASSPMTAVPDLAFSMLVIGAAMTALHQSLRS